MNRLIHIIMQLCVAAVLLAGCSKDLGNYDYHKINDATLGIQADTFRVLIFDTLRIRPEVKADDVSRFRYEWRVHPVEDPAEPLGIGQILVISRERDLNVPITLKARDFYYQLDFVATDTVTGVSYFRNLHLQVRTAFQNGWMLLEEKSGKGDISFIDPDNKVYYNIYSTTNPEQPLPTAPQKLISINTQSLAGTLNVVCFEDGGYVLDNTTLKVIAEYPKLFFAPPAVNQPKIIIKPFLLSWGPYTISGDKVYGLNGIYASTQFGAAFTQPDSKGYSAAPFVAAASSFGAIFFDQANHRFLYDGGGSSTALKVFPSGGNPAFDLNNVQKRMLTMKPGMGWDLWPDTWYALFKNEMDDNCFLYTLNSNGSIGEPHVASAQQAVLNSPDVHRSPDYLFSGTIRQMYYAADNKLYLYDMAANQSRVIYTFAEGENITTLQMRNNVIVLATYNGMAAGGSVYYLPISSTGDISGNTYSQRFTGFDKIVHLVYKAG